MSFDLFNLLPAVYRIRDAQIAESQPLLTPAEAAQLAALQALTPPLSSDQQAQLAQLTANASTGPLQSLLLVIQEQLAILAEDLDQLYDDQFIETCASWVIPYIGDLIGYQSVQGIAPAIDNPRSEVAETISFRRRKGTVLVMEQLARDATGWGAHAVEFFRILGDTQYMNHLRLWNHYAPDLRRWHPGLYIDTGFDRTSHRVDVRRISSGRGRYNIQNIGVFLWSLGAYSITQAPATVSAASPLCFRFSSLGMDIPLFHRAVSQGEEITTSAQPINVPDRLRRRVLCADIQKGVGAGYYGEGNSLTIYLGGQVLNPYQVRVADLSGVDGSWVNMPTSSSPYLAVVDPELGRIALPPPPASSGKLPPVTVSYYYGFNADMGGGEYSRAATFTVEDAAFVFPFPDTVSVTGSVTGSEPFDSGEEVIQTSTGASAELIGTVTGTNPMTLSQVTGSPDAGHTWVGQTSGGIYTPNSVPTLPRYSNLQGAINYAIAQLTENGQVAVEIANSQTYPNDGAALVLGVPLPAGTTFELRAAEGARPTLLLNGEISVEGDAASTFCLNGLLVAAEPGMSPGSPTPVALVHVPQNKPDGSPNRLAQLNILHCTLVPGWSVQTNGTPNYPTQPNLIVEPNETKVLVANSIVGAVRTSLLTTISASNSIFDTTDRTNVAYAALDNSSAGGALTLEGCTVVGKVHATLLTLVSDSIFWASLSAGDSWAAPLIADRKQQGCVRFSFLPIGAITPRRFECVEQALASPQPVFFATRYGHPGYLKLLASTPDAIRRGADDAGEMGAFHFVLGPLREADLRIRMQEYLPVGLEFGVIYQN
jgi:hypothetical protein